MSTNKSDMWGWKSKICSFPAAHSRTRRDLSRRRIRDNGAEEPGGGGDGG